MAWMQKVHASRIDAVFIGDVLLKGRTFSTEDVAAGVPSRLARRWYIRRMATHQALIARIRKICMALPDAVEKASHGEPTWFAGKGKVFAMLDDHHHGAEHLSVWLPAALGAQEA